MSPHPGVLLALSCDQECPRLFPVTPLGAAPAGGVAQGPIPG